MTNNVPSHPATAQVCKVLNDVIGRQGRKVSVLAKTLGINQFSLRAKLAGRAPMPDTLARKLAAELGIPTSVIDHLSEPPQAA